MDDGHPQSFLDRARRSLIVKITAPPVLIVLVASLLSAHILGQLFTTAHESSAEERSDVFADVVEHELRTDSSDRHVRLEPLLAVLCRASEKIALVTDRARRVRFSCRDELRGSTLPVAAGTGARILYGGTRWIREMRPIVARPGCVSCHGDSTPIGYIAVDAPLAAADAEVRDQKRMNLIAGTIVAGVLSAMLILVQVFLVYRPVRAVVKTIERIRAGDLSARAVLGGNDELSGLASSLNDMAGSLDDAKRELDRTHRAELVQAEKLAAMGQLISSIAHEIKNPLAGIIGALRVIHTDAAETDASRPILGKILAQMERLSQTVVAALEFARPLKPTVVDVDIADLLERTLFFVERQAREQAVQVRKRYATDLPRAHVDPDLMKQVFLNLILNAIQAMPRGGVLEIEARRVGDAALDVVVSDQGVGIASENLDRIFSPFFSTKERGTGLGLYVARQIVETQRGQISVESHPGQGTAFTVRIPAGAAGAKESAHDAA